MPYAYLLDLAPNFCAIKKLLKSWAQGAKVGCRGTKPFMKSTPGRVPVSWFGTSDLKDATTQHDNVFCFLVID